MQKLIVLSGMPRSGTTWVGKIFDSHPHTLYRHEPDCAGRLNALPLLAETPAAAQHGLAEVFLRSLSQQARVRAVTKFPIFRKTDESRVHYLVRQYYLMAAKSAARLCGDFSLPEYLPQRNQMTVVWKSIESTGRLPLLAACAEKLGIEAYFIHIIRHPCGQLNSTLSGQQGRHFGENYNPDQDLSLYALLASTQQAKQYGLSLADFQRMSPEQRLTWRWALINDFALKAMHTRANYLSVRYEDVCLRPDQTLRQLFDFCHLDWHTQTEAFLQASTRGDHPGYYSVIKNPFKSAYAWRTQLDQSQVNAVLSVARKTLAGAVYAHEELLPERCAA